MTAAETLRAAAAQLRDRSHFEQTGEPDTTYAVDAALADWLETTAIRLHHSTAPEWMENVEPHAFRVARAVLGDDCPGTRKEAHDA